MSRAADLLARVRLIRTPSVGPVTYRQLLLRFGSAEAALAALPDLAARGGGKSPAVFDRGAAEREIEQVTKLGARYLAIGEGLYPSALAQTDGAPPLLIAKGEFGLFERPLVAIVGARNASAAASRFARQLAWDLGQDEVVVVSGLARGIDAAAHDGAMDSGTIGCAAGGIDIFYPPENEARQRRMYEVGVVLSETPPGYEPRARDFPRRNRIIAGLSAGTVVVEAAPRSGSLITARMATEMGREVMAVPGSPLDQRAQGCNELIREGATLIQNAAEVMEAVRPGVSGRVRSDADSFRYQPEVSPFAATTEPEADERARVEELLGPSPAPVDEIVRLSGLSSGAVQLILLELDLAGRLDRHAGGQVSLNG